MTFNLIKKLIVFVKPLSFYLLLAILFGLLGHIAATFIGVLAFKSIVTKTIPYILFILVVLRAILRYLEQEMNHYVAFKLLAYIRSIVFKKLITLAPSKLDGKDKGNLISMITSDIEMIEVFYAHTLSPIFIALFYGIIMIYFYSTYHIVLGIVACISYILIGVVLPIIIHHRSKELGIQLKKESADMSSYILESLRGLFDLQQYHYGKHRLDKMNDMNDSLASKEQAAKAMQGINSGISNTLILLSILLMVICGIYLNIDSYKLQVVVIGFMASFGPFVSLSALGSSLTSTFASSKRVFDLLDEKPEVEDVVTGKDIENYDIDINNITFGYDYKTIFDNFSFHINKNETVGIVGKSGCGKSTLLKLIMRFIDVNEGSIHIGNDNIKDINTTSMHKHIGYVSQDSHLFHDTIRNNICLYKDASLEEVIEASKKANIHDFIMSLEKGYDTVVGELGCSLSLGQAQRINLARCFLHDSEIILLDEPTSHLDRLNEAMVLNSLKKVENKTMIYVSHRVNTMKMCDRVLYFDKEVSNE